MRIQIARSVKCVVMLAALGIIIAPTLPLRAEPDSNKTKQRLSRQLLSLARSIDEIKWANVNIYRVEDEYKQRLIVPQLAAAAKDSAAIGLHYVDFLTDGTEAENFYNTVMKVATPPRNRKLDVFIQKMADQYGKTVDDVDPQVAEQVLNLAVGIINRKNGIAKDYLLITTRDKSQPLLIALVGIEDIPGGGFTLKGTPMAGIDMYDNLKNMDAALYEDLREGISSNNKSLISKLFTLRDLSEIVIVKRSVGQSKSIDEEEYPHLLLGVSAGRPLRLQDSNRMQMLNKLTDPSLPEKGLAAVPNAVESQYEIAVGTDIIASFISYKTTPDTLPIPDPDWGVELKAGFDEINYPSIWGGRLTLNAILENIKIGAVLPQFRFGDSSMGTSGFGSNHQNVIGGYGLAVSGDFTAPLLANSGLFNFYGSYTFAESDPDQLRLFDSTAGITDKAYLIRYAAQLYYSFGFYADAEARHLFRLKIGGTAYGVDTYTRRVDVENATTDNPNPTKLLKESSDNFGGISGKIEYMKTGQRIPWGGGIQYLDQTILTNIWLQFAVTPSLDLKFEGKYFAALSPKDRKLTHPWENPSLVVPSISVKYHF